MVRFSGGKDLSSSPPRRNVFLLEAESSFGGVWAEHRLYPGLKSNNLLGTYESSDFPMDEEIWGVKPGEHIPAQVLHNYLTAYAEKFGVLSRTRFRCKVERVERGEKEGWVVNISSLTSPSISAKKLIVATGLTSRAFMPTFQGQELFGMPLFHSKDFLQHKETIATRNRVTVLGGTKSAYDAVYMYAINGVEVDWIIRETGNGPCWMAPPYVTPFKRWLEKLAHTRFLTWMSPCVWGAADGYGGVRSWLHGTAIGRFVVDRFWAILGGDVLALNKYDSHPKTAKLKPWVDAFWTASDLGILNYETNFFDLVKSDKVRIHIADIAQLSKGKVHLTSGEEFKTEALLSCTGWNHTTPIKFSPPGLESQMGLLHENASDEIQPLVERADAEILASFPRLTNQPKINKKFKSLANNDDKIPNEENLSSLNLYRFMVPPSPELFDRHDIAFAGNLMNITTAIVAQIQALWTTAYLDGEILPFSSSATSAVELDEQAAIIQYSATLHNRFGKWRYPGGKRGKIPDFVFDALPYVDMLLKDLNVNSRRKGGGWREISEPYGPEDYVGVVQEWIDKQEK